MDDTQYTINLGKCTGLIFYGSYRTYERTGTYLELKNEYEKVQRHNKLFGWWFGLFPFINYRYIKTNKASMAQLEQLHNTQAFNTPNSVSNSETPPSVTPTGYQSPLMPEPSKPKRSKKKIALIVLGVIVGLIVLLALIPAPPEDSNTAKTKQNSEPRPQPAETTIQRFNDQKFEIAIPSTWTEGKNPELQNTDGDDATNDLKKLDLYKLFVDKSYQATDEFPTIYVQADKHQYIDDEVATDRIKRLENTISNQNGHKVTVTKDEVKVGKNSKYTGYLYTYEDTFDKDTKEKLKNYQLYVIAHGYKYFVAGFYSADPAAAKYDAIVKQSVLSLNPDE